MQELSALCGKTILPNMFGIYDACMAKEFDRSKEVGEGIGWVRAKPKKSKINQLCFQHYITIISLLSLFWYRKLTDYVLTAPSVLSKFFSRTAVPTMMGESTGHVPMAVISAVDVGCQILRDLFDSSIWCSCVRVHTCTDS